MFKEKRPGKVVSFPVNPDYLKDLQEGKVFRHDFAKERVLELLPEYHAFAGFSEPELESFAEKITRCMGLRKDEVREKSLDAIARDEIQREARSMDELHGEDLWSWLAAHSPKRSLSITEIIELIGDKPEISIRKTWVLHSEAGRSNDDIIDALKRGRYRLIESKLSVHVYPEFD